MVRLTTPTLSATDPVQRARSAFGVALGILYPSAVPLRDARVRLTRDETLAARAVRAIETLLTGRARDRVNDDRLLAEAVALVGTEAARARGELPARGATEALDRYLRVPGLDQSRRTEADAMLRVALSSAAPDDPAAAARLEQLRQPQRAAAMSAVVDASAAIERDAQLLGTTAAPSRTARRRAQVGSRHRRAEGRRVWTSQIRGTGLATGNRPSSQPPLTSEHALDVLSAMDGQSLTGSVTAAVEVDPATSQAILQTPYSAVPQHVRIEIGDTTLGALGKGVIRSGTADDPHVLRMPSVLSDDQVRFVMTHQLAQMTQEVAAAEAGQSNGVLHRVRSVFSHERRDRRLQADHAAFQVVLRDWHDARTETLTTGRTSGPRSLEDLQRDLEGVARTIRRHGGTEPALPWKSGTVVTPDAAALGVAAARAESRAKTARHTVPHLRAQVVAQIQALETAAADLDGQASKKRETAAGAAEEATAKRDEATTEEQQRDLGAAERGRVLRDEAIAKDNKSHRHTVIADGYERAAGAARQAVTGYRDLLTELDGGASPARIAELAGTAERQVQAYRRSVDQALPAKDLLMTGQPDGDGLKLPIDRINAALAAANIDERMPRRGPLPLPAAEYRRLMSRDGMVFFVQNDADQEVDGLAQVRLRMKSRDVTEIADRDHRMAEQMSGTLGDGGTSISTTDTHASTFTAGVNLGKLMAIAAPGTPLHAAAQLVSPKAEVTRGRTLAETGGASAHYQSGWVDDNRGESLLYEWSGEWEIEVRRSPLDDWSPVETADAGRQQTWVSSAYTVPTPTESTSLEEAGVGHQVTGEFPRHTVTSITGLQDVTERLVRRLEQQHGSLDRVGYNHIAGLMVNDSPRLLRELSRPGGITRQIPVGGESEYELTWEVQPVWAETQLVGESSTEMWQEEVLVDFGGLNANQTYGASSTGTVSVKFPGDLDKANPLAAATALNNVAGTGVDVSPSASVGRNVSRSGGQSVSMTAITPVVQRNMGPTQGVLVGLQVKATLRKVGDPTAKPIVETGRCEGLLRVPENDLLRAGGRAAEDAIPRNPDGTVRVEQDGRVLLRGDDEPAAFPQTLPPSIGPGENQLRGVGRGMAQNLTGAEEAQEEALKQLERMGLVAAPGQKATLEQRRNRERIRQQILAPRIEAGIDQACQGGLIVMLEERGPLGTPHWRPFRLSVEQERDEQTGGFQAEGLGVSKSQKDIKLGIASWGTGRTSGRNKSLPLSAGIGGSDKPAEGVSGASGKGGVKVNRNAFGRNISYTVAQQINHVALWETSAVMDRLREGVRIKFGEITDRGDTPLVDVPGTMDVAYDSALTRAAAPVFATTPKPPHAVAVRQAIPVAVDAGNAADALCQAIPAIRSDTSALPALHAALSPSSLIANRQWMNGEYRLPFTVVPAPGNPLHALTDGTILPQEYEIVVRGEAVESTHLAMSQQTTVDINFTMNNVGSTIGTSASGGVSADGGGGAVEAGGLANTGGASLGRTGGTSQSTTTSETSGDERLLVNPGTHHEFIERYTMTADIVHQGQVVQSIPLPDALAQKALPERRALELYATRKLDLPLWVAEDAAERYLSDRLPISHRVAAGFISRYQREKAGVTTGLAAEHTAERLAAKLRERSKVAPSHAADAEEQLRAVIARTEKQADHRRVVHTSEAYDESLGAAQLESITVEGTDEPVDLRKLVEPQVDELAPGLRDASRVLRTALDVNFSPTSYDGHLDDMFAPSGFEAAIEVPIQGQERPDVLLVLTELRYEGERTIEGVPDQPDGSPDIPRQDAGGIGQNYDYQGRDRSVGHSVTISGGVDAQPGSVLEPGTSVGVGTDQTKARTAGSGEVNTLIDRLGHFDQVKTHRTAVFRTQVVRLRNAGAAAMASARWKLGRIDPADVTSVSEPREVRADIVQWIPRGDIMDGPRPQRQQELEPRTEHRPIALPEGSVAIRVALHGEGDERRHELLENLTAHLRRPGVLGERGVAEYAPLIQANLKPTALRAKAGRLLGEGIQLQPLAEPGNGRSVVEVSVHATAVGWELHGPEVEGQEGRVWRRQEAYRASSAGNRLTPLTANGSADGGLVSVGGSVGEQVKEQSSDANGTRLEGSRFLEGDMVTVRIPLVYDATVTTSTNKGRGEPIERKATHLPSLARGEMFVRMLKHRYLEVLQQMENGASLDAALAEARLQAEPADFGPPDISATEYVQGESGAVFQPYRPLVDALAKAKIERRDIVLQVQEADGTQRTYKALKTGSMVGQGDGGYASAFATLHPNLALMAEGRVDLRALYNTSEPGGSFSAKVAGALEQAGVPREVLKGLDYSTAARTVAPAAGQGGRPMGSAPGRHISPTGHGPSLSGP
ncbi:hypothetical protein [Kribbella sp. NPDC048915]|uniref:hypothetical protein n=1 Tax=Kribbella sp. NPDC048915 TaxID=3155148 RepID=UPI0033ED2787